MVIDRDFYCFIFKGYYSVLNFQLQLSKKRAYCKKGVVDPGLLTTSTQPGTV